MNKKSLLYNILNTNIQSSIKNSYHIISNLVILYKQKKLRLNIKKCLINRIFNLKKIGKSQIKNTKRLRYKFFSRNI